MTNLLERVLSDKLRIQHHLNILFGDIEKNPNVKNFTRWCKEDEHQTDNDIQNLYDIYGEKYRNYGYACGHEKLIGFDFDWPWVYQLVRKKFGARLETYTVKTPNEGYRAFIKGEAVKSPEKYKTSLHIEILQKKYAVCYGEALREDGEIDSYKIIIDKNIIEDNSLPAALEEFLGTILKSYKFLTYSCITSKLPKKKNHLTHEQRLAIANFMLQNGVEVEDAAHFFSICPDFNLETSRYQVQHTWNKLQGAELSYPTCETLREHFGYPEEACKGCPRKREGKKSKKAQEEELKKEVHRRINEACNQDVEETWIPAIMAKQTTDELKSKRTKELNFIGLNKKDAPKMAPINEKIQNGEPLTQNENNLAKYILKKHWRQLTDVRNKYPPILIEESDGDEREGEGREKISTTLINYCLEDGIELYHDQKGDPYARVPVGNNGCYADLRIKSPNFAKKWLSYRYFQDKGKAPNAEALTEARNVLEAIACFKGKQYDLKVRVSGSPEKMYYDLTNGKFEAIEIDEHGWRVVQSPIMFSRFSHQLPQVYPQPGGKVEDVLKYINLKDEEHQHLFLLELVTRFITGFPHPVTQSYGDKGSAKSTADLVVKKLVDPSSAETLTFPRDVNGLIQGASHHYLAVFDNVSYIPQWINDLLCKICTGIGFSKRELYSDDEDVIYALKHCVALNGINISGESPDLADRSIFRRFQRIPLSERRPEAEFWAEFEKDRAKILGAIFDCVSKAIPIRRNLKLPGLQRMADFTLWGYAIAEVLKFRGRGGKEFLEAYEANIAAQNQGILEASIIGDLVVLLMKNKKDKEPWEGTPSELLAELENLADQQRVSTKQKGWPKAAHVLTKKLQLVKINLQEVGIFLEVSKSGERKITLLKSTNSSVQSAQTPKPEAEGAKKVDAKMDAAKQLNEASKQENKNVKSSDDPMDAPKVSNEASYQASMEKHDQETLSDAKDAGDAKIPTFKETCYKNFLIELEKTAKEWEQRHKKQINSSNIPQAVFNIKKSKFPDVSADILIKYLRKIAKIPEPEEELKEDFQINIKGKSYRAVEE